MKKKTQERMKRRSRKRSSSAGSEKRERVGDRKGKIERYCSTGQSPQRAVAPTEEEGSMGWVLVGCRYMTQQLLSVQKHLSFTLQ